MSENLNEPQSRTEEILQNALGEEYDVTPQSRVEKLLTQIFEEGAGGGFEIHICSASEYDASTKIPTIASPDPKTLYLVPSSDTTGNLFDEYIYVDNNWEKFGGVQVEGWAKNIVDGTGVGALKQVTAGLASGRAAYAEGGNTTASGEYSHAEGSETIASWTYSHAEGRYSQAKGLASHAEGIDTKAYGKAQHVFGECNIADSASNANTRGTYIEVVGNGANSSARSNARTLDWSGNEWLAGSITLGNTTLTEANLIALLALLNA